MLTIVINQRLLSEDDQRDRIEDIDGYRDIMSSRVISCDFVIQSKHVKTIAVKHDM